MNITATRFDPYAPTPEWTPPLEQPWDHPTLGLPMETPGPCSPFNPYAQCGVDAGLPGAEGAAVTSTVEDEGGVSLEAVSGHWGGLEAVRAANVQAVHEPGVLLMTALGLAALARRLRR